MPSKTVIPAIMTTSTTDAITEYRIYTEDTPRGERPLFFFKEETLLAVFFFTNSIVERLLCDCQYFKFLYNHIKSFLVTLLVDLEDIYYLQVRSIQSGSRKYFLIVNEFYVF